MIFNNHQQCLHNLDHIKTTKVCQTCIDLLNNKQNTLDDTKIPLEYRTLAKALTNLVDTHELTSCWHMTQSIKTKIKGYKLKNLFYAFYKGDIHNSVIKMTCGDLNCYNPFHMKSRFEPDQISKRVRVGFSKKYVSINDLTDNQWLRY